MKSYIEERALEVGNYIVEHNATVRQAAKNYGISKSTVHKDVSERLPEDQSVAGGAGAWKVLDVNKSERHIRGGDGYKRKVSSSA